MSTDSDASVAARPPTYSFSTDPFAPEDRFEAWRGVAPYHEITADPRGFEVQTTATLLDRMMVIQVTASSQTSDRSARRVRADGLDYVMLRLTSDPYDLEVDGRWVHMPAGSLATIPYGRPCRKTASAEQGSIMIQLSRSLVVEALPDPEDFLGHVIPDARDTLLGTHVAALARQAAEIPMASAANVARATAQLLAATLAPSRRTIGEAQAAIGSALAMRCKRYIERHLRDPGLSPDAVCRDVGVSRSALYRLFATSGGVADYIRDRRLSAAMTVLSEPGVPRISDVAHAFGFADPAAFSRAFRAAFGCSPRDVINDRGRVQHVESDEHAEWIKALR